MFNFCSYFISIYFVVFVECRRIRFSVQIVCVNNFAVRIVKDSVFECISCCFGVYAVVVCVCSCEREVNLVWPAHVIAFANSDRGYFYMFSILFLSVSFTQCLKIGCFFSVRLRVSSQYLHRAFLLLVCNDNLSSITGAP